MFYGGGTAELFGRSVFTTSSQGELVTPSSFTPPPPSNPLQEMQVEELGAVRQALQADLETSIRRIVDLQAALEEVESSDESDSER